MDIMENNSSNIIEISDLNKWYGDFHALKNINQISEKQNYWAEQSCYKYDGNTSYRIMKMIEHFIKTGERKQIEGDIQR